MEDSAVINVARKKEREKARATDLKCCSILCAEEADNYN